LDVLSGSEFCVQFYLYTKPKKPKNSKTFKNLYKKTKNLRTF